MYNSLRNQRAPGMQVHAVPEAERAVDSNGRRLPWGYDYSGPAPGENGERQVVEKGPFGRSMRRSRSGASRSRSKTAEPKREEDRVKMENMQAEDLVFNSLRRNNTKDSGETRREAMGEVDPNTVAKEVARIAPAAATSLEVDSEPSEVLLWGFGEGLQWAAIDFYERVSNGNILEDYERQPPGQRYDISRSLGRAAAQKSLSRAAMRKKNRFAGGEHWIKVTFDSRQAAELATARQPHIIKGYLVYAEPYVGRGPAKDEAVIATQAGAQITNDALPPTFATGQIHGSPNGSDTVSSATATAPSTQGRGLPPWNASAPVGMQDSPTASSATMNGTAHGKNITSRATGYQAQQNPQGSQSQTRRLKVEGAVHATVYGAEMALAPKQPKASWTSWIGASEVIGSAVPRKEDGNFDWDRASMYWRLFWWIDTVLGTDFCGLRGDD